jgi:hypothetical protein
MNEKEIAEKEIALIKEFQERMIQRFKMGRKQYGFDYLEKDLNNEIDEEILDIAGYAMLMYLRLKIRRMMKNEHKDV